MSRWLLKLLNIALLVGIAAAIPYMMTAYAPVEKNNKAVEAIANKQYDEAIALLSDARLSSPENPTFRANLTAAYQNKAISLEEQKRTTESLMFYEKALDLEPDNQTIMKNFVSTINNLAVAHSNRREFAESQQLFERAAKSLKRINDSAIRNDVIHNYSALLTLWGAELMKANKVNDAVTAFTNSLNLDPQNAVANIYLGDLRYEVNDYEAARQFYSAALPFEKDNKEYLKTRLEMIADEIRVETLFKKAADPQNRFLVHYVDYTNGVTVSEMLDMLAQARTAVGEKLGIYPARAVNVKVYNARDFFRISRLPEWAIGIFDGKLRLKVDDLQSAPSQVKDLLFHEYTHAVLAMNIKQKVPAWFHEGMAQMMEPQFAENPREQAQMRDALARTRLDFNVLKDSFKDITSKTEAETAYLLSKYFLSYLNTKYGHEKLMDWVARMTKDEEFEKSFQAVYGLPLEQAQNEWIKGQVK
ncbi:MAG: tetratricopeptide repeat protein [Candidatus Sumerlaeaceae bacterium]|nr:tetratricopeptide repeat protein [Candidatus Sumerlaeaceae bacterium]